MKSLKQLREEYNRSSSDETIMLEANKSLGLPKELGLSDPKSKLSDAPSSHDMPTLLMFRRITYKRYPNNQIVALYYSKMVDKYLSIPFGPGGNIAMSEAVIHDTLEEGPAWEATKGGLKGAAHGAAKGFFKGAAVAADPGAAIGAVLGGIRGGYKGAKNAYNKAKETTEERKWECKSAFREKLAEKRMQEGVVDKAKYLASKEYDNVTRDNAGVSRDYGWKENVPGYVDQKKAEGNWKKGNVGQALKYGVRSGAKKLATAAAVTGAGILAATGLGAAAVAAKTASGGGSGDGSSRLGKKINTDNVRKASTNAKSYTPTAGDSAIDKARSKALIKKDYDNSQKKIAENKISDLKKMIEEGNQTKDIEINGRSITLNTSMAKRIVEVYDSVNAKNKKVVESMLNEDLESFKKLLNFSIKAQ